MEIFEETEKKQHVGISLMCFMVFLGLTFLSAYVLQQLWGWFLVPLGVRSIRYVESYGLGILMAFIKDNSLSNVAHETFLKRYFSNYVILISISIAFKILFYWAFGAIAHYYIS